MKFDFSSRICITDKARQQRNVPANHKSFTWPSYPIRPVPFKVNSSPLASLEAPWRISALGRGPIAWVRCEKVVGGKIGFTIQLKENWTKPLRGGGEVAPIDALSVIFLLLFSHRSLL